MRGSGISRYILHTVAGFTVARLPCRQPQILRLERFQIINLKSRRKHPNKFVDETVGRAMIY